MEFKSHMGVAVVATFVLGLTGCGKVYKPDPDKPSLASVSEINDASSSDEHIIYRDSDTNQIIDDGGMVLNQKYTYMTGSKRGWSDGVIKWWYNPSGQPSQYSTQQIVDGLIESTRRWENVCGVTFKYQGLASTPVKLSGCDRANVVGWGPLSGSVVGQAQVCYSGSYFNELDLVLDNQAPMQITSLDYMMKVSTHEFGHTMGLGHTDIKPAVMTAILSTGLPVQDDIDGCQSLYDLPMTTPPPTTTTTLPLPPMTTTTTLPPPIVTTTTTTTTTTTPSPAPTTTLPNVPPVTNLFCQPKSKQSCELTNGDGLQVCHKSGKYWGACKATTCDAGYVVKNGRCRRR